MSPLVLIFPQRSVMGVSSYWVVLSCKECAQPGLATPVINGLMSLSADFTNQNRTATCFSSGPPSRLRTEKCTRTHILQVRLLQIVFEIYVYYDAPSMRLHEPKGFSRKNMYSLLEQTRHSMIQTSSIRCHGTCVTLRSKSQKRAAILFGNRVWRKKTRYSWQSRSPGGRSTSELEIHFCLSGTPLKLYAAPQKSSRYKMCT